MGFEKRPGDGTTGQIHLKEVRPMGFGQNKCEGKAFEVNYKCKDTEP